MSCVSVEPEDREPGEHLALVGDRRRVDDVVGRDPVGGDHQQVVPEVVDLADLALGEEGKVGEGVTRPEASSGSGGRSELVRKVRQELAAVVGDDHEVLEPARRRSPAGSSPARA